MSLEGRIANWVDLGFMPYMEAYELQISLAELRKKDIISDTILQVQHPLEISFGSDSKNNLFSDQLIEEVRKVKGNSSHESILEYCSERGVGFSQTNRSGGAALFAPGQFVYYLVVDHPKITGAQMEIGKYKSKIYAIMFDALRKIGVGEIAVGSQELYKTRKERRDAWVKREGIPQKMGSKGIRVDGRVAYQGFVLHIDKEGLNSYWMVNPCGYGPEETKVASVEEYLGKKINPMDVHGAVRSAIKDNFGYTDIKEIMLEDLIQNVAA